MSHQLVLVTAATGRSVGTDEMKLALHVTSSDEDALIGALIYAAERHIERLLGVVLVESTWRFYGDAFETSLELPITASEIVSVIITDEEGADTVVDDADYRLVTDAVGNSSVLFLSTFTEPTSLAETQALAVEFTAGVAAADVAPELKAAIKLLVGHWFNNREAVGEGGFNELPLGVQALIGTHWRPLV